MNSETYCDCSHSYDHHAHYGNHTQCVAEGCDCPRPRSETYRMLAYAWMFIIGCVMGLWALSGCLSGAA